jgi:hypothetical protein
VAPCDLGSRSGRCVHERTWEGKEKRSVSIAALATAIAFALGVGTPAYAKDPPGVNPTHYQCYRVKQLKPFKTVAVKLRDQFGTVGVKVIQPVYLCAPTDKNGEGLKDKDTHLLCCQDRRVKTPNEKVRVINQFGEQDLVVVPFLLCVPSLKKI